VGRRLRWALVGLAGLAALAVLASGSEDDKPRPSAPTLVASIPKPAPAAPPDRLPEREGIREPGGDLFAVRSWKPPPPPAQVQPPQPPPPPPPRYRFGGTALEDGALKTFLADGDQLIEIRNGQVLEGNYRVESLTPREIVLVYVPLGTRQRIDINSILIPEPDPGQRAAGG